MRIHWTASTRATTPQYSGTVGAALETAFQGCKGILRNRAVSRSMFFTENEL